MKRSRKVLPFLVIVGILLTLTLLVMPIRAGASVNILSHTGYLDSYGYYNVVGEVQNAGDQAANTVEVTATFYDSKSVAIASRFDVTLLFVLETGEKSPFVISLYDTSQSANVSRYDLSVTSSTTSSIPLGLEISSDSSYKDNETNILHVVGEVRNIATGEASHIKVVVTCYDKEGNVTAAAREILDQPEQPVILNPGQATPFDIPFSADRTQYIASHSITAESDEYALVPEFPLLTSTLFAFFALTIAVVKLRKYSISRF